jgi:hypothetical protein
MGDVYSKEGRLLKFGTTPDFDPLAAGDINGDMSEAVLYSEWFKVAAVAEQAALEFLWTGPDAAGALMIKGSIAGPGQDLGFDLTDIDPDGTAFAGSLTADDLRVEDLGSALIGVNGITFPWARLVYTKASGGGTANLRIHEKQV